jgi:hypothetical protein
MSGFENLGKLLIVIGIFVVIAGLLLTFWSKIPFLGRLPGDIVVQKDHWRFFFPLVTCLAISAVLTIVINVIIRFFGK